ncbi:MAG: glycosyltransferase family 39 protein [Candidatus Erginobacter occultus]|nr:glycosyltransferase family 39 protein [Candidatus Erginobacter occultus]
MISVLPFWPARLQSRPFHRGIWERLIAWLLGFGTCLLVYRVARVYYSAQAAFVAVTLGALGGPLLTFVARWPCQTNLPTAFLAALLLYVYHFADRRQGLAWLLLGSVWGFGVLVRNEFAVWGLLPAYGIIREMRSREPGRRIVLHGLLVSLSAGFFLAVIILIQLILYGSWGNTYGILADPRLLTEMPRMLFGPRNGLFPFWPVFLLALIGYLVKFRANPGINHLLFGVLTAAVVVCTTFPFWLAQGGQRPLLMVVPCFMLFLARLLDIRKKLFWIWALIGLGCVFWAVLIFFIYGNGWELADGSIGYLKANTLPEMLIFVFGRAGEFFPEVLKFIFLPKSRAIWPLLLILIPVFFLISALRKCIPRRKALPLLLAALAIFCAGALVFLAGAGKRGRKYYQAVAPAQPDGWLRPDSRYHIGEYFAASLDYVAYFLEFDRPDVAKYFEDRSAAFLEQAAPGLVEEFRQTCEAFRVRHSLGWKLVFPAGPTEDPRLWLRWYYETQKNVADYQVPRSYFSQVRDNPQERLEPPIERDVFRTDFKEIINSYRVPGSLYQR